MRFREITGGLSFLKNVAGKKQLCYPAANIFVDHCPRLCVNIRLSAAVCAEDSQGIALAT